MRVVIISSINSRKAFDISNVLKSRGYTVIGVVRCGSLLNVALPFAYGIRVVEYRDNADLCLKICEISRREKGTVFLPIEESDVEFIHENEVALSANGCRFLNPSRESFWVAKDKDRFHEFCRSIGVDVPKIVDLFPPENKSSKLPYPFIVKPRQGAGARGVKLVQSYDEVERILSKSKYSDIIAQEYIKSHLGVQGAFFVAADGEVLAQYSHERIITYPRSGGVTVVSISGENREILNIGSTIIRSLKWSGFAMIEFILDSRDGKYKVIEMNPRTWGSIILGDASNANVLENYITGSLGGNMRPATKRIKTTFVHWMFPWQILIMLSDPITLVKIYLKKDIPKVFVNMSYANPYRGVVFHLYMLFYSVLNKLKM
jgi:predicted ATP-grasp superfamily ATP-dependent carboligase